MLLQASTARSIFRAVIETLAPSLASIAAARCPTGPVPAKTTAFLPTNMPLDASFATAAAAVVLLPLLSNITETLNPEKKQSCIVLNNFCPARMSLPPTNIAVFFLSLGARVKMAPSTSPVMFSDFNPPNPIT